MTRGSRNPVLTGILIPLFSANIDIMHKPCQVPPKCEKIFTAGSRAI
jgi:hypothetical protein